MAARQAAPARDVLRPCPACCRHQGSTCCSPGNMLLLSNKVIVRVCNASNVCQSQCNGAQLCHRACSTPGRSALAPPDSSHSSVTSVVSLTISCRAYATLRSCVEPGNQV